MYYIRHMWIATSKSNVEFSTVSVGDSRRFDIVVFNSNLFDSDVPSQSSYLSN